MQNLSLTLQSLQSLRDFDCIYVDKTELIYKLVTTRKYAFLSRPRRFGKSLLVSTMFELFSGNRDLFKGLWIDDKWNWSKIHPVIHLSFDSISYRSRGLAAALTSELSDIAEKQGVILTKPNFQGQFKELLEKVSAKHGQVVLLIDEYDKPIIDFLEFDTLEQAKINQGIMKEFYSVLKSADKNLRFFFITGVSKFSRVSLFSDLNNLKDITIMEQYATITGYTQTELEHYFDDYLNIMIDKLNISRQELLNTMRLWYDGFSWDGINQVYNPFGVQSFLDEQRFDNYWFSTGTPTFLIKQMKKHQYFNLENISFNTAYFNQYDIENIALIPLCFQTGYLTIKSLNNRTGDLILGYPNKEVKESMYSFLINDLAKNQHRTNTGLTIQDLNHAFLTNNLPKAITILNSLVSSLPTHAYKNQSEGFYHGLLHLVFSYVGLTIESEVNLANGRSDVVIQTPNHVFIFEFKFDKTAQEGLMQIKQNAYANKYQATEKPIIGIGVNFDPIKKEINDWCEETL